MKIIRPRSDIDKEGRLTPSKNHNSMLTVDLNEEYAMKDENERQKQRAISKEFFS